MIRKRSATALLIALWFSPRGSLAEAEPPTSKPQLTMTPFVIVQGRGDAEVTPDFESGGEPRVELRRLRVGVRIKTQDDHLGLVLHTNVTQSAPELVDLFVDHRLGPLKLRWGQAKIPFTGYRQESFALLPTTDWSPNTRIFGAGRQLGAQLMKDPDRKGLYGAFGVFQGTQLRPGHDQGVAPLYRETSLSYTDFRRVNELETIHPEGVGRLGWRLRPSQDVTVDLEASARVDARPTPARDLRRAMALEGKVTAGPWLLRAITYGGQADRVHSGGEGTALGLLFQARYGFTHRGPWLTAEYSQYSWSPSLQEDARARATQLIAEATEKDRAAVTKAYGAAGRSAGQWTALLALRHDLGPHTSLTAEVARVAGLRTSEEPGVLRFRFQAQVAF